MKLFIVSALGALALAAPAFGDAGTPGSTALYPETVPGAGLSGVAGAQHTIVRELVGRGLVAGAAFQLSTTHVAYTAGRLHFRSTQVRAVLFGQNAVKIRGTGLVGGRLVSFTAVGVHNALPGVDVFKLAWNHGASLGGRVSTGMVFIR